MLKRLFATLLLMIPLIVTCDNDTTIEEIEPKMTNNNKNSRHDDAYINLGFYSSINSHYIQDATFYIYKDTFFSPRFLITLYYRL